MRLLDARALIHEGVARLVDDTELGYPQYAILSHTWGREEVLFEDIRLGPDNEVAAVNSIEDRCSQGYSQNSRYLPWTLLFRELISELREKPLTWGICSDCRQRPVPDHASKTPHIKLGWNKVYNACLRACYDGLDYIWIDNCCINKDSSAELTEAINAMFPWYAESCVCYVYLEDCRWCPNTDSLAGWGSVDPCSKIQLEDCRWLTRGWTLQELLAPAGIPSERVNSPHSRDGFEYIRAGGVDRWRFRSFAKRRRNLRKYTIAERMSWAAGRRTTRVEDRAYSLLGLFDVNMPLLYGEGDKAFIRLQKALIETSTDSSLLAWDGRWELGNGGLLLARSPDAFNVWRPGVSDFRFDHSQCERTRTLRRQAFSANSEGLTISLPLVDDDSGSDDHAQLPQNWDPGVSSYTSFALLGGQVLGGGGVWQNALRLRHWTQDGEYILSEVILAPEDNGMGDNAALSDDGSESAGFDWERLSVTSVDEISTAKSCDLFILWQPRSPREHLWE